MLMIGVRIAKRICDYASRYSWFVIKTWNGSPLLKLCRNSQRSICARTSQYEFYAGFRNKHTSHRNGLMGEDPSKHCLYKKTAFLSHSKSNLLKKFPEEETRVRMVVGVFPILGKPNILIYPPRSNNDWNWVKHRSDGPESRGDLGVSLGASGGQSKRSWG